MIKKSLIMLSCLTLMSSVYGHTSGQSISTELGHDIHVNQLIAKNKDKKDKKSQKKKDKKDKKNPGHPHYRHKAKEQYAPKPKIPMDERAGGKKQGTEYPG